eukprot:8959176-Lingulodinium_polyedra.AAC.1
MTLNACICQSASAAANSFSCMLHAARSSRRAVSDAAILLSQRAAAVLRTAVDGLRLRLAVRLHGNAECQHCRYQHRPRGEGA